MRTRAQHPHPKPRQHPAYGIQLEAKTRPGVVPTSASCISKHFFSEPMLGHEPSMNRSSQASGSSSRIYIIHSCLDAHISLTSPLCIYAASTVAAFAMMGCCKSDIVLQATHHVCVS